LIPATEPFFIFVKSNDYFFDKDAFLSHFDLMRKKAINAGVKVRRGAA
jgi:hypothetical protein